MNKDKFKKFMLGTNEKEGVGKQIAVYALLICIGFIYVYPLLYMISQSFMSLEDLIDTSINWLPSAFSWSNFKTAAASMDYWNSLWQSVLIAGIPTIGNIVSCAVIGYGLARFEFKGKKIILAIIIFSFVLPSQITMIPTYVLYSRMGILGTVWAFILPSFLGMGLKAPIFILIFYQFFKQIPNVLIEAAQIDGAGYFKSFIRVSLPSAVPAIITVALFSFVWYWNESYLTELYVRGVNNATTGWSSLVIQVDQFATNYNSYASTAVTGAASLNESLSMAGTLLSVLPLILMYFILQRYFVESIDRAGITGE